MSATAPVCDFGWPAADAILTGVDRRKRRILDSAGPRGLVVAFICNHCPYVKAVIGRIVRDARDLRQYGIGFVAINPNDASSHPDDSFANMVRFAQERQFDFPYLHDADQSVARAYNAVCTPDFFGFNASLSLQYRGRLDASRKEEGLSDIRRDLYQAMTQIANCGHGPDGQIGSIGCSIKWKERK